MEAKSLYRPEIPTHPLYTPFNKTLNEISSLPPLPPKHWCNWEFATEFGSDLGPQMMRFAFTPCLVNLVVRRNR